MANLMIPKTNVGEPISALLPAEWDPFRRMRDFLRWDPLQEFARFTPWEERPYVFAPAFDVRETKDSYIFKADLPGIKEQDVEITLTGNRLTITGKRETEQKDKADTYYAYERSYGSFIRLFTLPDGAVTEPAKVELKDGVLTLVFSKLPEVQPKKIQIKGGEKAKA